MSNLLTMKRNEMQMKIKKKKTITLFDFFVAEKEPDVWKSDAWKVAIIFELTA